MRVAVLGSGNGGVATAFDFAQHGHQVALFDLPEFGANIAAVAQAGGIHASGDLEGFAAVRYSGHDLGEAMAAADLVLLVGPAYSTEPLAALAKEHLRPGMAVLVCPTSCAGAVVFKKVAGLPLDDESVLVGETSTLPYAVRVTHPGTIKVFLKLRAGLSVAGLPRSGTDRLHDLVKDVYPAMEKADSVFQTTLQNGNPVIHPAVTLLNAGLIERTHGAFLFYEEGVTEAVGRLIEAVDLERLAIAEAMGVRVLSEPELGRQPGLHGGGELLDRLLDGARVPRHRRPAPARQPLPHRGRGLRPGVPHRPGGPAGRRHPGDGLRGGHRVGRARAATSAPRAAGPCPRWGSTGSPPPELAAL